MTIKGQQRRCLALVAIATSAWSAFFFLGQGSDSGRRPSVVTSHVGRRFLLRPLGSYADPKTTLPRGSVLPSPHPPRRKRPPPGNVTMRDENGHLSWSLMLIAYHKTGHDLAGELRTSAGQGHHLEVGRPLDMWGTRRHPKGAMCPAPRNIRPGAVYKQEAPDLFCDAEGVIDLLLRGREGTRMGVLHMVRNPFTMMISNYKYHRQWPTPELWVLTANACPDDDWARRSTDLTRAAFQSGGGKPVMSEEDFTGIIDVCREIYRTRPGLEHSYFYDHLSLLDPLEGLSLATANMFGEVMRMANNVIKFEQARQLGASSPEIGERLRFLTLSMDDFKADPARYMRRAFDFILMDGVAPEVKEQKAEDYAAGYRVRVEMGDPHIMTGRRDDEERMMETWLREHPLWGRILGNVESVIDAALRRDL